MTFHKKDLFRLDLQFIGEISMVMAHPVRVRIMELLVEFDELNVRQLSRNLPLDRSSISHHLRKLRQHKLVDFEVRYPYNYYSINAKTIEACELRFGRCMNRLMGRLEVDDQ